MSSEEKKVEETKPAEAPAPKPVVEEAKKPAEAPVAAAPAPEPPKPAPAPEKAPEPPKSPFAYEREEEGKKGRVINKSDACVCVFEWEERGQWFSESRIVPDIGNATAWVDSKF